MSYKLKKVNAPKLVGLSLRLVTWLCDRALLGGIFRKQMLKLAGIPAFRRRKSIAAPTLFPLVGADRSPEEERSGTVVAEEVVRGVVSPPDSEFSFASIVDYARAYRQENLSPDEVASRLIKAVEATNASVPPLRAIIKCNAEDILQQAAECTRRLAAGQPRSILEGVPVAIKDELDMPPYTTDVGTSFLGRDVPLEDATPVARLRAAGALLVGKANMYEIGISPTGNNPIHGFARNPYNLDHDAGGSSGGCGAAVGSGLVPLAIGADGGGSIRVPAAHCGVFGLKPTFGRISEFGAAPLCWSVAHVGPLGATSLDAAIGYAVCSGGDVKDPMTAGQPPVHLQGFHERDLSGVTLGIYEPWFEDASSEIVHLCEEATSVFERAGAVKKKISIKGLEATRVAHAVTILSEMATAMNPYMEEHGKDFSHPVRLSLALGRNFNSLDYVLAQQHRTEAMAEWKRVLSTVDVVLTPTTACPPPFLDPRSVRFGESDMATTTEIMRFVVAANFCGLPAMSIPVGYTAQDLPIGLQMIGRHWEEDLLLRLANVSEPSFQRRRPSLYHNML